MSWTKIVSIQLIVGFFFLELFSFLGSMIQVFTVNDTPILYRFLGSLNTAESYHEGRTEREAWGVWRHPNTITRLVGACFDVEISANEIGARDSSFEQLQGSSWVLLGDSFAEGFGVEYKKTTQYIIEQKLDANLLNFGVAGDFGPLQQYIIYRDLASRYEHEELLVFVLPANDFSDNDRTVWQHTQQNRVRYRPYYSYVDDNLIPWYFPEAIPTDSFGSYAINFDAINFDAINFDAINFDAINFDAINFDDINFDDISHVLWVGLINQIKNFLVNNLWLSNPLRSFSYIFNRPDVTGSYYLSASNEQQADMVNAYSKIVELAGKPVSFVVIPTKKDFLILEDNTEVVTTQYWYQALKTLALNSGGAFIDLLYHRTPDINKLFHECDWHWSEYGNDWAAQIIFNQMSKR